MKTYEEAIYNVAEEYFHESMNTMMPRLNVNKARMIAFIFDVRIDDVCNEIVATARENSKEFGK